VLCNSKRTEIRLKKEANTVSRHSVQAIWSHRALLWYLCETSPSRDGLKAITRVLARLCCNYERDDSTSSRMIPRFAEQLTPHMPRSRT
jgi:hypothetical protein